MSHLGPTLGELPAIRKRIEEVASEIHNANEEAAYLMAMMDNTTKENRELMSSSASSSRRARRKDDKASIEETLGDLRQKQLEVEQKLALLMQKMGDLKDRENEILQGPGRRNA